MNMFDIDLLDLPTSLKSTPSHPAVGYTAFGRQEYLFIHHYKQSRRSW